MGNVEKAMRAGADGAFLVNHGVSYKFVLEWASIIAEKFKDFWIGINLLGLFALEVFDLLPVDTHIKGVWVDDAGINDTLSPHEQSYPQRVCDKIATKFKGIYFGGVAFKYQRDAVNVNYIATGNAARNYMDVVTTSGIATGVPADIEKVKKIKMAIGKVPLALASGVSSENVHLYSKFVDCFIVPTSVSDSFHELSEVKMQELVSKLATTNV